MNKSDPLAGLVDRISKAIESFPEAESSGKQLLNQLASSDPAGFFAAGIHAVAAATPSEGSRYLILTLAKDKRLSLGLLDSQACTLGEAVAVTRAAAAAGAQLQASFEIALNKAMQGQASPQKSERILRLLDILAATGAQSCWSSFQVELMAYPDKLVRSKAALLIGRSTRNVGWIARRLLDRDPRVQASAVEALWDLDPEEAKPHFLAALKSSNNRVAANAALGLYRCGDVTAMRVLQDMLQHTDPLFRLSALWAIGQTHDERFLPALTEHYKNATGRLRLATVGAMSRIRRGDKAPHAASPLQIHMAQAAAPTDSLRRLAFALSCHPARDLAGIKPTEFSVWENGSLIDQYQARLVSPPVLLMAGFVAPWFDSGEEGYEKAVREGLKQCLSMKRRDDLWRIDRYSIEMNPHESDSAWPYDDSFMSGDLKSSGGCISDPDLLGKVLAAGAPRERAAPDPVAALERQCDAFAKRGGKRHVFVFLHDMSGFDLKQDAAISRLRNIAQESSTVLHCICPDVAGQWALLRELCLSNPEGSFTEATLEGMVDGLVDVYSTLCSRFEITYAPPASPRPAAGPASVKLRISSGLGQAEMSFDVPPAQPVMAPATEDVPVMAPAAQEAPGQPA